MPLDLPFEPIEWSDTMETGIERIDQQHRYLVDTLRNANKRLLQDHEGALLEEVAHDLLGYAIMHFETEEECMMRYGYHIAKPELAAAHIRQHRDFSQRVVAICEQLRERHPVSHIEVLRFLNEWLRNHVLGVDQRMGHFLREAESAAAAGFARDSQVR